MTDILGPAGLPARKCGAYVETKLGWLGDYLESALGATSSKIDRVYVDPFAGPGMSFDESTGRIFPSGALRAVTARGPGKAGKSFTEARLVNVDSASTAALAARIELLPTTAVPQSGISLRTADSNLVIESLVSDIDPRAYVFVFADPESPSQLPFETLRRMRSLGHRSMDLYLLFPWGMGIRRLLSYKELTPEAINVVDAFYGTEAWRTIYEDHPTSASRRQRSLRLRELYMQQLRGLGWSSVREAAAVNLSGERNLYWMLFATSSDVGNRIAGGVTRARTNRVGQGEFF